MKRNIEPTLAEFLNMHYIKYQIEGDQILLEKARFCKGVGSGPYVIINTEIYYFAKNPPKFSMMLASLPANTIVQDAQEPFASQTIEKFDYKLRWNIREQKLTGSFIEVSGTLSNRIEELLRTKLHFEIGNKFILCCEKNLEITRSLKRELADSIKYVREVDLVSGYRLVNKTPLNWWELKPLFMPTVKEFLDTKKIDYIPVNLNTKGKKEVLPFEAFSKWYTESRRYRCWC
jgi:hypothetical protein